MDAAAKKKIEVIMLIAKYLRETARLESNLEIIKIYCDDVIEILKKEKK